MLRHSCPSTGKDGSDIGKSQKATPKHMLLRRKSATSVEKPGQSAKLLCLLPLLAADTTCYVGAAAPEQYWPSEVTIRQGPKRCSPVPHASVTVTALLLGSFYIYAQPLPRYMAPWESTGERITPDSKPGCHLPRGC